MTTLLELSDPAPDPSPADWNDEGVVYLPRRLDPDLVRAYQDEWEEANGFRRIRLAHNIDLNGTRDAGNPGGHWDTTSAASSDPAGLFVLDAERPGGWPNTCPYMGHPALLALCTNADLARVLGGLLGEPAGLHLNLTGWVSTQRNWHQDGYLNPDPVGDSYAAVWMALDDIHSDSGVFEYVPGSHRWHRLLNSKIAAAGIVDMDDPTWPAQTEAVLTDLVEAEIKEREAFVVRYAPEAGDVLIWHPRLYHRGTAPTVPGAYRPALIAHYSGIYHRPDMDAAHGAPVQGGHGGHYWRINTDQPVR